MQTNYVMLHSFSNVLMHKTSSVLWHCWLGYRKGIGPVKTLHHQSQKILWTTWGPSVTSPKNKVKQKPKVVLMDKSISCCLVTQWTLNKLCAWRHNMPRPSPPGGRPSASQTQRSSTFPRQIRSHARRCTRLTR